MSKRRHAREMAVQMLYQSDLGNTSIGAIVAAFRASGYGSIDAGPAAGAKGRSTAAARDKDAAETAFRYAKSLVEGTLGNLEEIDSLIRQQAEHWRLERMPAVDRNILRLAIYEFLYETDVPKLVILDEAIELAKEFGSEQSGRFVNGVLDGILKSRSLPGRLT